MGLVYIYQLIYHKKIYKRSTIHGSVCYYAMTRQPMGSVDAFLGHWIQCFVKKCFLVHQRTAHLWNRWKIKTGSRLFLLVLERGLYLAILFVWPFFLDGEGGPLERGCYLPPKLRLGDLLGNNKKPWGNPTAMQWDLMLPSGPGPAVVVKRSAKAW